ncbi:uncharacterized protein K02A2.6-like, partial [Haliotis rubra]|uniref:uncharacterized protein K02A2.6-like n=1 Tax=Haliotis rubra TaxID=36100 RepID=UPI001EE51957
MSKSLHSAPKRLQRMMMKLQKFDVTVTYQKGTELYVADLGVHTLPQTGSSNDDVDHVFSVRLPTEIETEAIDMKQYVSISNKSFEKIQAATRADHGMKRLIELIQNGWPETRNGLPKSAQDYFNFRDELSVQDDIIFKGERVVIPPSIRQWYIERIHSNHIGINGCIRRARELVYWPNMVKDLTEYISKCEICKSVQQEQGREPLISHEIPARPMEKIACDLFEFDGRDYLLTVDYFSDLFEFECLREKNSSEVIGKLKAFCARHGIPDVMITDNGLPFNSNAFASFAQ